MISEQLSVLFLPFLACLVLTGIHGYLGIHVLARKVIFVDIALAQIAALGSTVAYLMGYDPHSTGAYLFSLGFAVLGAGTFALTRNKHEQIPQEAIIGLTYAIAAAAAILVADIAPHGAEHLQDLLAGSIVWVTPDQVKKTFFLYSIIGIFHYVFRKKFLLISFSPEKAFEQGIPVRFWDFLFYLSFGVVITSSVQVAGVLLVFCYLVAPAVFGVMFADTIGKRLIISWTLGTLISALGLLFSYDRPSGPTIMCFFALALIVAGLYKKLRNSHHGTVALSGALGIVAGVVCIGFFAFQHLQIHEHEHEHEYEKATAHHEDAILPHGAEDHGFGSGSLEDLELALDDDHANVRAAAALKLGEWKNPHAVELLLKKLPDSSDAVKENVARALTRLADPTAIPHLQRALQGNEEDPWVRFRLTEALAGSGDPAGVGKLVEIVSGKYPRLLRNEALAFLLSIRGQPSPAGALDVESPEGKSAATAIARWWKDMGMSLSFDRNSRSYK